MAENNQPIAFMRLKWVYFAISLLVIVPGTFSLIRWGLRLSIDFTGGSLMEIHAPVAVDQTKFTAVAASQKLELSSVQTSNNNTYLLRFKPLTQQQSTAYTTALDQALGAKVAVDRFESVGPTIGAELTRKALLALVVASLCIILYIAWSFRRIPRPYSSWKFGVSAVIALLHDALVVTGLFSIFGHFYGVEVDTLFVTALLTVIGFSVHDTIVVFDRVRENLPKLPRATFSQVVDFSLTETLNRSLNTSLTVLLTLTALILFGGDTIRWFVIALLIGIFSGTYSSIFNASPILVLWEQKSRDV